ncbi:hypothetical protein ACTXT7_006580 [Hymenolepis weldensis]
MKLPKVFCKVWITLDDIVADENSNKEEGSLARVLSGTAAIMDRQVEGVRFVSRFTGFNKK